MYFPKGRIKFKIEVRSYTGWTERVVSHDTPNINYFTLMKHKYRNFDNSLSFKRLLAQLFPLIPTFNLISPQIHTLLPKNPSPKENPSFDTAHSPAAIPYLHIPL